MSSEIKSVVTLITFGTAVWVIAGIVLAITGAEAKVIWTCVAGAVLGAWEFVTQSVAQRAAEYK